MKHILKIFGIYLLSNVYLYFCLTLLTHEFDCSKWNDLILLIWFAGQFGLGVSFMVKMFEIFKSKL